ncbi:unnamed protein product [Chrysoparadoxa australica]
MKNWILLFPFLFISCYQSLKIDGFDQSVWERPITCEEDRIDEAKILMKSEKTLLESNQNEIQKLLGHPDEHELYSRNQKFFYYDLSLKCDTLPKKRLALRFDALGRVNEVNIIRELE